jgi:hypothetical protein
MQVIDKPFCVVLFLTSPCAAARSSCGAPRDDLERMIQRSLIGAE